MKGKNRLGLYISLLFFVLLASIASAQALPVTVDRVEIDDVEILPDHSNRLDFQHSQELEVEVKLTAHADVDNLEIEAFISGFEYNDIHDLSARTQVFDADAGVTYVKRLKILVPDLIDEDDYKLRLILSDRNSDEIIKNYNLKLDVPRHSLKVEDVVFFPFDKVLAGRALLTTVRVENVGEKDEGDVKVTVSIPAIGVSASDYINEVESGDEEETEEIFLRIPESAKSGVYDVRIDVEYNQMFDKVSKVAQVNIVGSDDYAQGGEQPTQPKTLLTVGTQAETIKKGDGGVLYPITISNNGKSAKTYTVSVEGADWAYVKVNPSNVVLVEGGKSKAVFVYVEPKEETEAGAYVFAATVSANGKPLEQVEFTANVKGGSSGSGKLRTFLEVVLVALIVLLVLIGVVLGVQKMRRDDENGGNMSDSNTFY